MGEPTLNFNDIPWQITGDGVPFKALVVDQRAWSDEEIAAMAEQYQAAVDAPPDDKAELYIGGIPFEEYNRLAALDRRPLTPADLPDGEWSDRLHADLFLRSDGAIVFDDDDIAYGWITPGGVDWVRG